MKRKIKKISACLFAASLMLLAGCQKNQEQTEIYFLSWKPEAARMWKEIAGEYEAETGVKLKVITAPNASYERVLSAEIAKKDMPTFFQVSGIEECNRMKNIFADLKDTEIYSWLLEKDMAITRDGEVHGIPAVVEGYGIIYNKEVMNRYFALSNRETDYQSVDQIRSLKSLKEVVEDMTKHKSELGIKGVFASTSFKTGEDWRWNTHLMNMPLYYEFQNAADSDRNQIQMKYGEGMLELFDLYLDNSIAGRKKLKNITVDQSINEFAVGSAAMIQNGNWAWNQIKEVNNSVISEDAVGFLPLYIGAEGEENQGICIGTENYFCVNALASEEQQKASIEFLEWLYSSETGKKFVSESLGFIPPYATFEVDEVPNNPLAKEVSSYMNKSELNSVQWIFSTFPNNRFKEHVSEQLYEYVKGNISSEEFIMNVEASWAK